MISGLLILLIAICSRRHYKQDKQSILIFAAICGFFQFFHNEIFFLIGFKYYLSAAFVDLFIIHLLSKIHTPTNNTYMLQKACLCFIYINLFGWVLYEAYYEPLVYELLCYSLFASILFISFKKGKKNVLGNHSIHINSRHIFSSDNSRALEVQRNKEAQRP